MLNIWYKIPDDAINKDFYKDKVCTCRSFVYKDHWDNMIDYNEAQKLLRQGTPHLLYMKCGGLIPTGLSECRGCRSIFYKDCFTHPDQREPAYDYLYRHKLYCWHCLETNTELMGNRSWRSIDLPKSGPPVHLLNPYVKPKTHAEKLSELLDSIDLSSVPVSTDVDDWWK